MTALSKPKVDVEAWISNATHSQLNLAIKRMKGRMSKMNAIEIAHAEQYIFDMEYELLGRCLTTLLA